MQAEEVYLWNVFTAEGNTNAKRNTIPGLWEKLKYKFLAPAQKRFPNVKVEGVGGGLENDKIK